jgi:glyoxylase-like metal-dependent hydrolase (beta-lactamase superfamily II)
MIAEIVLRALLVTFAGLTAVSAQPRAGRGFELVRVADGVYAAVRKEPPGFAVEANSLFIIGEADVIVVDAQSNSAATREVLAALRGLTDKPVRYVVNTHWHDDHIVGNQVYREAFPGVEFIAHARTRDYLPAEGETNRRKFHEAIPTFSARLSALVREGKNLKGEPLGDEERASYLSDISLAEGYMTVPPDFRPVLPTITLQDSLTLHQGGRTVEILSLGRGHTSGDLVVHLPRERVVASGDLVVWPVPLVGSDQSHVGDWGATLEKLRALRPAALVPGHGPVMRDDSYVQLMARLMNSLKQQAAAAVARGETLEQTRKGVHLEEFRKAFAGDSKVRNTLFSVYVVGPAVESAFRDAVAKP